MGLNASGPISLAGTTAGQSIEVELNGNGTTQISLNDAAVRALAGVPSGAITMPTNFWGKSNSGPFFWAMQSSTAGNLQSGPSYYDSSTSKLYQVGKDPSGGGTYITSFNAATPAVTGSPTNLGSALNGGPTSYPRGGQDATYVYYVDSNYRIAQISKSSPGSGYVQSYNSSTFGFGLTFMYQTATYGGNCYMAGLGYRSVGCSLYSSGVIVGLNSSGTKIFASSTALDPNACHFYSIAVNASYIYGAGMRNANAIGSYSEAIYIAAFSFAGTLTYGGVIYDTTDTSTGGDLYGVALLSTGDVIFAGYGWSGASAIFGKVNSTLSTVSWAVQVSSASVYSKDVAVDSSNNIYILIQGPSPYNPIIVKYNSSGTLQWQRQIQITATGQSASRTFDTGYSLNISDTRAEFIITGQETTTVSGVAQANNIFIALPLDGSKTGTYALTCNGRTYSMVYSTASLTFTSKTCGVASFTTSATPNFTLSALSYSTSTNTNVVTSLTTL